MHYTFCPHCARRLVDKQIGDEGMIPYCEDCRIPLWDTFTTSIIAAVVNEYREVALLRQNYVSKEKFVCVAGIMKIGESAEDAVIREVKEEIGQDVESLEFISSFPYEKKDMLMLGYKATVKKQTLKLSDEVDSAEWVEYGKALSLLTEGSIAYRLVNAVVDEK